MSEEVTTYRPPDTGENVMIQDDDGKWVWLVDYIDLRAENERLTEQLAAQDAVIEAVRGLLNAWYQSGGITSAINKLRNSVDILATIGKGTSTPSVTMEPDK